MKTDTEIKVEGTRLLVQAMGAVEAERYIALIARDRFDYTIWRQSALPEKSLRELSAAAMTLREKESGK